MLGNIPKDELREYHEGMPSDPFAEVNLACLRTKISKKALPQSFDAKKSHQSMPTNPPKMVALYLNLNIMHELWADSSLPHPYWALTTVQRLANIVMPVQR